MYNLISTAFFLGDQDVATKYMQKVESLLVNFVDPEDGMQNIFAFLCE